MRKTKDERRERVQLWVDYYRRKFPGYSQEKIMQLANLHPWLSIPSDPVETAVVGIQEGQAFVYRCPHCGEVIKLTLE